MREQAPGAAGSRLGEARWIVFNPAQVMQVTEPSEPAQPEPAVAVAGAY
jgi:hypothetical protein